jgi:hypothetical protein
MYFIIYLFVIYNSTSVPIHVQLTGYLVQFTPGEHRWFHGLHSGLNSFSILLSQG